MRNHFAVVTGMKLRADFLREVPRFPRIAVGNRDTVDRRMLCRESCTQRADATRADDAYSQCFAFDGAPPHMPKIQ
jgi:hypothetical protein